MTDATNSGGPAEEVPAGGAGADSGSVDAARIDDSGTADIANISSQNDIPGVGTRAADGSMESSTTPRAEPRAAEDAGSSGTDAGADRGIQRIEPGVDPESARTSKVAGDAALAAAGLPSGTETVEAPHHSGRRGLWLLIGAGIAVIAIVVFAILVPQAPALAWIGIALQVALVAMLAVSAFALRAGPYRQSRFAWITGFQGLSAVVLLVLIAVVAWLD